MFFLGRVDRKKNKKLGIDLNKKRIYMIGFFFTLMIVALIGRLYHIQFIKGEEYYHKAKKQWLKEVPRGIARGKIYDRNMKLLTNRNLKKYLVIFPNSFKATDQNIKIIKEATGINSYELKHNKLLSNRVIELEMIKDDEKLMKKIFSMKGVFPIEYSDRYDKEGVATHVIGYINKIDNIGKIGIEKMYDEFLKEGQLCKVGVVVDAQKRIIPGLEYEEIENKIVKDKKNIVTTLDYEIQKIAEKELDRLHKKGSIVIIDVKNGDIVAMVSRPKFEQNNVASYLDNGDKELYNRAIQVAYPPGSIFKIIVAAAALENNLIDSDENFFCEGYEEIGNVKIKCSSFKKGGHEELDLERAFALSCNSTFIQLGQRIGGEKLIEMAKKFGLGSLMKIGLEEEIEGTLPTKDYMKGAGIGNISIGQGTLEVTPLQIARMTSIIANDGVDRGVYLAKKIEDEEGHLVETVKRCDGKKIISYETAKKIQRMMEKVVSDGTGKKANFEEDGMVAGKTGSSQAVLKDKEVVHAWFTGYFPSENPKYVITVIVEDGGSGGGVAAPLFREIAKKINK